MRLPTRTSRALGEAIRAGDPRVYYVRMCRRVRHCEDDDGALDMRGGDDANTSRWKCSKNAENLT